mgnify:CR=1 FL=1
MVETELGEWRRSHYSKELKPSLKESDVTIMGWISSIRSHGNITFIALMDQTGEIQIVAKKGSCSDALFENISKLKEHSSVGLIGTVKISEKAKIHRIPVISNGANASNLSSIKDHPWFIRVVTPSELYERYLIDVAKQLKVLDIAYFFTTDAWGQGASKVIHEATKKNKINK